MQRYPALFNLNNEGIIIISTLKLQSRCVIANSPYFLNRGEFRRNGSVQRLGTIYYSPNLALCNCILFPKLKLHLKRKLFENVEGIKRNSKAKIHAIIGGVLEELWIMENSLE